MSAGWIPFRNVACSQNPIRHQGFSPQYGVHESSYNQFHCPCNNKRVTTGEHTGNEMDTPGNKMIAGLPCHAEYFKNATYD